MPNTMSSIWNLFQPSQAGSAQPPVKAMPKPAPTPSLRNPMMSPVDEHAFIDPSFLGSQKPVDQGDADAPEMSSGASPSIAPPLAQAQPPMPGGRSGHPITAEELAMQAQMKKLMADRQGRIDQAVGQDKNLGDRPTGFQAMDLSPLAAWVDSTTGSNLKAGYSGPRQLQDYDAQKKILQGALDKERNGLTDDQMKYLQMKAQEREKMDQNDARRDQNSALMDMRNKMLGVREDSLGLRAGNSINDDSIIKDQQQRSNQMGKDLGLLNSGMTITPQRWDEIQQGIAQGLAGSRGATVDSTQHQRMDNVQIMIARFNQKWGMNPTPQDINSPQFKADAAETLTRLKQVADEIAVERAQQKFNTMRAGTSSSKVHAAGKAAVDGLTQRSKASQPMQTPAASSGPAVGTVEDGHRFKGGNPSDPNAWEKI